jgi:hypothetical protein
MVQVETVVIWEFVGERIRGETVYFDLATMLRQAGALTLPGAGSAALVPLTRVR